MEKAVPLEIDFVPDAAVSGAAVHSTELETLLTFVAQKRQADGLYHDAGCAMVRFERCLIYKFGYPNDEAWSGIPRTRGLVYGGYEILNSGWNEEISELNKHSFPNTVPDKSRHFLFLFHDSSFECLANGYSIEVIPSGFDPYFSALRKFLAPDFGVE